MADGNSVSQLEKSAGIMFENLRDVLDFDDLLFENRNREYGAYQIRKRYKHSVVISTLVACFIVCAAIILPFIINPSGDLVVAGGGNFVQLSMENMEQPPEELYIPPVPPPPSSSSVQEIVKYVPPVVVDSLLDVEKPLPTVDEALNQQNVEEVNATDAGFGDSMLAGDGNGETDNAFFMVEVMPSFRGGDLNKFRDWVFKHTNYPQAAVEKKITGKVYLTFIIETDGSVSNVTVVKGVDPLIDIEAVKSIQASPKWSPGLQRGQPVRVRYSMWLNFVF